MADPFNISKSLKPGHLKALKNVAQDSKGARPAYARARLSLHSRGPKTQEPAGSRWPGGWGKAEKDPRVADKTAYKSALTRDARSKTKGFLP